jgi:hypothetical protein
MPVGNARDQQPEADPAGVPGKRGEGRHPFETVPWSVPVHGPEVVEAPGAVEPELLTESDPLDDLVEIKPLLCDVDTESLVRERGFEPLRPKTPGPKPDAAASYATPATALRRGQCMSGQGIPSSRRSWAT